MRISTTMVMNSYADNLNSKYESINKYSNQISTTLAYSRASEDPVAAMQTIKSCTEYTLNAQNQSNEAQASSWMDTTESTLSEVNSILTSAYEKATEAANGTNSSSDFSNYATAFKSYRDELVSTLNTSYDGQYIFGGSSDDKAPFSLTSSGILQYYNYNNPTPGYVNISSITNSGVSTASLTSIDDLSNTMSVNVGTDTPFDASTSGLDVIIQSYSGTSSTAINIVDQLTKVINQLTNDPSNPDTSGLSDLMTQTTNAKDAVSNVTVAIGEKSNMLTQISSRLTDNETNLTSALANTMEVDSTQAIMKYNMAETVYKESMSMASTILQTSLFDYIK